MNARAPISLALALTALFAVCLARPAAAAGVAGAGIAAGANLAVQTAAGEEARLISPVARRRARRPRPFYPYFSHYPYYRYGPRGTRRRKMSCAGGARLLRRHGYRGVRAYDCRGGAYGYTAYLGGRRYRVRLGAYSGDLLSKWRD